MVVIKTEVSEQEARRRAELKATQAELDLMQQEERRRQDAEQAEVFRRQQSQRAADDIVISDLRDLKPLYDKRQEAFDKLEEALRDFMTKEADLRPKLENIYQADGLQFIDPRERRDHIYRLREQAGLARYHDDLEAGTDRRGNLAWTVAAALLKGMIQPFYLWDGNKRTPLNRP